MKYTIEGFSQEKLIEFGMDVNDAIILRWFVDFKDTGKMASEIVSDDKYYWINYEELLKDLPIMNIKKDTLYRRLKKMESVGILKHFTKKQGGTYSMYAISSSYCKLVDFEGYGFKSEGYGNKSVGGTDLNPEQKINLLNKTNLLNSKTEEPVSVSEKILSKTEKVKLVLNIEKVQLDFKFINELINKYDFETIVELIKLVPKDAENQGAYLRGIIKNSKPKTNKITKKEVVEVPKVEEPKEKESRETIIANFCKESDCKIENIPTFLKNILNKTLEGMNYEQIS